MIYVNSEEPLEVLSAQYSQKKLKPKRQDDKAEYLRQYYLKNIEKMRERNLKNTERQRLLRKEKQVIPFEVKKNISMNY